VSGLSAARPLRRTSIAVRCECSARDLNHLARGLVGGVGLGNTDSLLDSDHAGKRHSRRDIREGGAAMPLTTILIIVLILVLIGALPTWPYSRNWGYFPGGALGLILLVVIILLLMGRI
jgi:hypothetical protein